MILCCLLNQYKEKKDKRNIKEIELDKTFCTDSYTSVFADNPLYTVRIV